MQVFGYEKNGDATFFTATGKMDGNRVTAPLMQYQGGRSFGGGARDAVELGSPGHVKVSFHNGLQGGIQLPGEAEMPIQKFEAMSAQFEADYVLPNGARAASRPRVWTIPDILLLSGMERSARTPKLGHTGYV